MRSVRELEIEATSLFERADNALKLIGDQYLSRVFDLASTRFHLRDWQQSIRRKLETVGDVYDLLVQQAGGQRMEVLEIIVVVLIALEIVLAPDPALGQIFDSIPLPRRLEIHPQRHDDLLLLVQCDEEDHPDSRARA